MQIILFFFQINTVRILLKGLLHWFVSFSNGRDEINTSLCILFAEGMLISAVAQQLLVILTMTSFRNQRSFFLMTEPSYMASHPGLSVR